MHHRIAAALLVLSLVLLSSAAPASARGHADPDRIIQLFEAFFAKIQKALDFDAYEWTEINPGATWAPRAGLESVELDGRFYVMGGRTPLPPPAPPFASIIQRDVWVSEDRGNSWSDLGEAPWPARAFFESVTKDGFIYVMGGQSFDLVCPVPNGCPPAEPFPVSTFYNDVWRSRNGIHWEQVTADAGWAGRAGLSAVVFRGWIYVFGGAEGDDEAIGGAGREFFRDVWRSRDGRRWFRVAKRAPWPGRGGAAAVVKDGSIYLLGGEAGFLAPALSDVWRTRNGRRWKLVNANAWQARSGHKCGVLWNNIFCFGGFSLLGNPMDVQRSRDGMHWTSLQAPAAPPWLAASPEDIKYDFDVIVRNERFHQTIYTFGGDRETFESFPPPGGPPAEAGPPAGIGPPDLPMTPPDLRVDNDVWRFAPGE